MKKQYVTELLSKEDLMYIQYEIEEYIKNNNSNIYQFVNQLGINELFSYLEPDNDSVDFKKINNEWYIKLEMLLTIDLDFCKLIENSILTNVNKNWNIRCKYWNDDCDDNIIDKNDPLYYPPELNFETNICVSNYVKIDFEMLHDNNGIYINIIDDVSYDKLINAGLNDLCVEVNEVYEHYFVGD